MPETNSTPQPGLPSLKNVKWHNTGHSDGRDFYWYHFRDERYGITRDEKTRRRHVRGEGPATTVTLSFDTDPEKRSFTSGRDFLKAFYEVHPQILAEMQAIADAEKGAK